MSVAYHCRIRVCVWRFNFAFLAARKSRRALDELIISEFKLMLEKRRQNKFRIMKISRQNADSETFFYYLYGTLNLALYEVGAL